MGDKDGAKEILQEVIKEGDADQQKQAQALMDSLG
jgi:FimV-like protein